MKERSRARTKGNRWLLKTDPEVYSISDLEKAGKAVWDGVTNNLALQNIRMIRKGDPLLIYHSGNEKAVVGLALAISDSYPDPKSDNPNIVVIDVKFIAHTTHSVSLGVIKRLVNFSSSDLVRLPRLSVVPLTEKHYDKLMEMAGM